MPTFVPNVRTVDARPSESVFTEVVVMRCPVASGGADPRANVTVTSSTGLPSSSLTTTDNGEDNVVHQHEIEVQNEMEDIFVIKDGVKEGDKFVLEGVREVRDGDKAEFEFRAPEEVLGDLKNKAE